MLGQVERHEAGAAQLRWGLVVNVAYRRDQHMGCENRVTIMWSEPNEIETVCDCCTVLIDVT